jgi:hypothetical protein
LQFFARLEDECLEAERLRERETESERERQTARLEDLQAAAAHAAVRLPERLCDPAVFQAELVRSAPHWRASCSTAPLPLCGPAGAGVGPGGIEATHQRRKR